MTATDDPNDFSSVIKQAQDQTSYRVKLELHNLSDAEVFAMWRHVSDEGFHPDVEFAAMKLEGKITADEFVALLLEEVDERGRKQIPQPELA